MSSPAASGTQAVDRAALLVATVVRADEPVSFASLAEECGLPKSTASRLLTALERTELVERSGTGSYVAGPLFDLYAARHDPWEELARLARPVMAAIGEETGETVNLGVPRGGRVSHIAQVDARYLLGTRDWTLVDVPSHASALGKVLYAFDAIEPPGGVLAAVTAAHRDRRRAVRRRPGPGPVPRLRRDGGRARARPHRRRGPRARPGRQGHRRPGHLRSHRPSRGAARSDGRPAHQSVREAHLTPREGRRSVNEQEILQALYDETLVGNAPRVLELTHEALTLGMEPQSLLFDALIPSLEEVGARFERGDFFVPEMLIAGRAMAGAMEVLRPLLAETGVQTIGKFLMGTVKGDVHDIGKNLVNIMLEGAGFEVIDLGVQVAPEKFVAAIEEHQPDIVGFSAFLTTTMPMFKANINALQKAGLRESVIVMVGGAPVTQEYADAVGADGYAADASACVKRAKDLLHKKRSLVNGTRWPRPPSRRRPSSARPPRRWCSGTRAPSS